MPSWASACRARTRRHEGVSLAPTRRQWTLGLALGLALGGCAKRPAVTQPDPSAYAHLIRGVDLKVDGLDRHAFVHVPTQLDAGKQYPVVVVFHGGTGGGTGALMGKHFLEELDQETIFLFPDGQQSRPDQPAWESRDVQQNHDVDFVHGLLDALEARYPVDSERIYIAGFSNGGFMTQQLACKTPERFAGMAVVAQTLHTHLRDLCAPAQALPMLYIIGTRDRFWEARDFSLSATDTLDFWLDATGCDSTSPRTEALRDDPSDDTSVTRTTYDQCAHVSAVELLRVDNGGHSWPGGHRVDRGHCRDIEATDEVLSFFRRHAGL